MKSAFNEIDLGFFSKQIVAFHDWIGNECVEDPPILSDSIKEYVKLIPDIKDPVFVKDHTQIKRSANNKAAVAFSGGKDSVAAALKLKSAGYDVELFFLKGVNRSFHLEKDVCVNLASKMNMGVNIVSGSFSGKHFYSESPVKNQLILSLMIDMLDDVSVFSSGNDLSDRLVDMKIKYNWSDAIEMYDAFEKFVRNHFHEYKFLIVHKHTNDALDYIMNNHPDLLEYSISCILPHRFNRSMKEKNEKTFGVKLLSNRCGSCEKCCYEYLYLSDSGFMAKNDLFYDHCRQFLKNKGSAINVPDLR